MRTQLSGCRKIEARVAGIVALAVFLQGIASGQEPLRFNRDIRPILSDTCFKCHGPDSGKRQAGLRLDARENAVEKAALVPGDPGASKIIQRITNPDPDEQMPPPDSNLSLTSAQKETLRRWIAEGGAYEPHWAFMPVTSPPVPDAAPHPVDAFIRARLSDEGFAPSPPAGKTTLLRRVTFDLTGLPPTVAELDAFLADGAPDAYERVVDRLIARPAYGERMTMDWLDVARYADTFGYALDVPSNVWPYRDWVIRAFDENLPYSEFIRWQLAGDLLPGATQDQILATAFNRLHRQTSEAGSILEEMRQEYLADRVRTASIAFLGLSYECARCHDHKFDPITQRDYYSMAAFFGNIDETGQFSRGTLAVPTPALTLYAGGEGEQHAALRDWIAEAERGLDLAKQQAIVRYKSWVSGPSLAIVPAKPLARLPLDSITDGHTQEIVSGTPAGLTGAPDFPSLESSDRGTAMRFSGDNSVNLPIGPIFSRIRPFSLGIWLKAGRFEPRQVVALYSRGRVDAGSRGWALELEQGRPVFRLAHFWPGNAIEVHSLDSLALDAWTHVAVTYDGSSRAAGVRIYVNGKPVDLRTVRDGLTREILYENNPLKEVTLGARFRDAGFKDGLMSDFHLFDRTLSAIEAAILAGTCNPEKFLEGGASVSQPDALFDYFCATIDGPVRAAREAVLEARRAESEFVESIPQIMVMDELPEPNPTFVLARGAFDAPTDQVTPAMPPAIYPYDSSLPKNRLGLAQWMLDARNPLTPRVAVNRYWKLFFGTGLVETQEDFGSQGTPPSHPELLDWLASWFRENDWDVKALVRLMVTSETYKQDSSLRPDIEQRDPFNRLLSRGPRARLGAEETRDLALAASGLLVPAIGGPSVKPYQPEGLWEDSSRATYEQDHGDALYRRSMYLFWKRTVPPPAMLTFDATDREVCVARRETTQTPLQSLTLLNETGMVEAARVLAGRLFRLESSDAKRIVRAYRSFTGRAPDAAEARILARALDEQRAHFAKNPEGAAKYAATGESPPHEGLDPVAHAALTAIVQAIMNLDESQVKS